VPNWHTQPELSVYRLSRLALVAAKGILYLGEELGQRLVCLLGVTICYELFAGLCASQCLRTQL
jgi:hypothetical protein